MNDLPSEDQPDLNPRLSLEIEFPEGTDGDDIWHGRGMSATFTSTLPPEALPNLLIKLAESLIGDQLRPEIEAKVSAHKLFAVEPEMIDGIVLMNARIALIDMAVHGDVDTAETAGFQI